MRLPSVPAEARRWVVTFGTGLASLGAGLFFKASHYLDGGLWWVAWIAASFVATRPGRYDQGALEAALVAFIKAMKFPSKANGAEPDLRCTLWVKCHPDRSGEEWLEQVTNYTPKGDPKGGRRLNSRQGIVGRAFRERQWVVERLDSPEINDRDGFAAYMVRNWGFNTEEARQLRGDRRSYFALPIRDEGGNSLGVVYCDSDDIATFDDPAMIDHAEEFRPFFRQLLKLRGA